MAEFESEWEQAGRNVAGALDGCSAVVVAGDDPIATAAAALGIARVHALRRRVALGDLIGDVAPIRALVDAHEPDGLADSFLYGISLNKIAHQVDEQGNLFVLPSGSESPAQEDILKNGRWRRLAAGFHEVGAMLLLAAPSGAPGLGDLARQLDGVVLVGDGSVPTLESPLLAHVRMAHRLTPASVEMPEVVFRPRRTPWSLVVVGVALLTALVAGKLAWDRYLAPRPAPVRRDSTAVRPRAVMPPESLVADSMRADSLRADSLLSGTARSDTAIADSVGGKARSPAGPVSILPLVPGNPGDSLEAAAWAVEMLAANTEEGAVLKLREGGAAYPAATVAPVLVADRSQWFKVIVGAFAQRAQADSLLARLLSRRVVTRAAVVRVPLALRLDSGVTRMNAAAVVVDYEARGIHAYALTQRDGTANIYVGAFAAPDEAALLAQRLKSRNIHATLVYRVGSGG